MPSYLKETAFFISFFITVCFANGQGLTAKVFSVSDDAASAKILSLIKHSQGYLIAGTNNGIFRFNGNTFQPYNFAAAVKNKAVTSIAEGNTDTIWIGFQSGEIGFIKNGTVNLLNVEEGHPKVAITSIVKDSAGRIFFATAGEGIYYYNNKRLYNINSDDGLSDNYVYEIKPLEKGGVVAATDRGINICNIINGKKVTSSYSGKNGIPDNIVRSIAANTKESFLLGMQDMGIGVFNIQSHKFNALDSAMAWEYSQVNSLINAGAEIWIGTENKGLIKVANNNTSTITFGNDLSFNKINNLLHDDEGNIWFTSNNQLVKTLGVQLQNIIPFTKEQFDQTHAILADNKGGVWLNNNKGLVHYTFSNNKWQSKNIALPFINEKVDITSLYQDRFNNIWIGSLGKGITILDPTTGQTRTITEDAALINASILSISGKGNDIWISSLGGAVHCKLSNENNNIQQPYTFENFSDVSGIGSNYVYSIINDSKNRVWFATDGKGITVYENGVFKHFNEKNGIKSRVVYSICEDLNGNIWFSTLNAGIYKYDGKSFTNISVNNGLSDATVTSLSTDRKGNIIAVTKKGVNVIDSKTYSISYIDGDEGINEWNEDLNCIAKTPAGNTLFVTSNGIVSFNPSYSTLQPRIVLESVQLFLKDIPVIKDQEFSHDENNISFSFTGISLSHPGKVQYQYRLLGFSNDWVSTKDNKINFPKLPPGTYTFEARASLNNSFTYSPQANYHFVINKPFWWQWWFIVLALVLVSGMLYWFIKNREKRVKRWGKLEKERIQSQFETLKSQVNPHFLFNSFNTLISVIEENPDKAVEYVEHLSDLYRKIVTYRDKDLISLAEEMELINDYYFIQQKRFGKNLMLNMNLTHQELNKYLIAPLTLQLLAENAVKHNAISSATPLAINIDLNDKFLIVQNNINPKLTVEKGAGMGLQNIQNRYKLLNTETVKIEKTSIDFLVYIPLIKAN